MNAGDAVKDLFSGKSTSDMVEAVVIETQFTPPITIAKPLADSAPNPLALLLRPKITLVTPYGNTSKSPYGEPVSNYWPVVQIGGVVALALLAGLLVRGARA